ncbi:MAG TPA: A/G-specific adenine glycosylase [Terriglobales bacterium]|nr:A/G-specific adenine glycosylase [Terriglobales bacterium]
MDSAQAHSAFRSQLLDWYERSRRDLPWRENRDPYRIWLSEIMLQQTRVAAVVDYYGKFLLRFPTVNKLASARESSVLAAWSGLGYYRRARMLHAAAKEIVKKYAGKFPQSTEQLRTLPGIGRYTAAAIASIAFDEPIAVVDGNVERVIERLAGEHLPEKELWQTAQELLSPSRPGDFNQAVMELGATVCFPREPMCLACPVREMCVTRGELNRAGKKARQKKQIYFALDFDDSAVFLVERPKHASLMPGMWELPEIAGQNGTAEAWLTLRHSITVTDYLVRVIRCPTPQGISGSWISQRRVAKLALTGLARKILRAANVI